MKGTFLIRNLSRCQTPTPTGQSVTLIRSQRASASMFRLVFSCPSSSIPTLLTDWLSHSWLWHNLFHFRFHNLFPTFDNLATWPTYLPDLPAWPTYLTYLLTWLAYLILAALAALCLYPFIHSFMLWHTLFHNCKCTLPYTIHNATHIPDQTDLTYLPDLPNWPS